MTTPVEQAMTGERKARPLWRLGVVVLLAAVSFAAALAQFQDAPDQGCVASGTPDSSYQARFTQPVTTGSNVYELEVTRDALPVTGARVCLEASMTGMTGMATGQVARESSPGRYEVMARFPMVGPWDVNVQVIERGKEPVTIALPVTVG
ncbi:MAG: FixH family protein [Actinobacteria bacterium]|nr:FixH family protein [Actinomycetota bacterium]